MKLHRSPGPWVLASLLGLALPARAGIGVGEAAPELKGEIWLNPGNFRGKTLADLRGSAVFLEYWQTW